jgi:hypothetical protein
MRKLSSIAGAAFLALTAIASPANAQSMSAGGSCGQSAGDYGLTDVNSAKVNSAGHTVPALFYTVNYNVPSPTTIGVIVRYNNELETQVQVASATSTGGPLEGALRANISPDAQGFANSINQARRGAADGPTDANRSTRPQNSPTQGGLLPGEYVFHIYTGSLGDVWNVKDGTVARNAFIADEKGYLGSFSCGVSTDQGSGPG